MGSTRVLKNSKSRDGAAVEAEGFCAAGCEVLIIVSTARAANKLVFTVTSIHSHGQAHWRTTITASALVASAALSFRVAFFFGLFLMGSSLEAHTSFRQHTMKKQRIDDRSRGRGDTL
jgi:hypothetical protein